ncbi:diaminohydroxyphosphoribosylaminopyrimidine deaminase [Nonomuraea fuscirosea]|uniref:Riboflavin biosynthesis protein RibD n=1 Tax=Nonomuraea fuscirosea TaxID=1291556 RepID=A0A2T0MUY0_9ACTN|nr:bifunctional diaminohydroxyphosphoribosylaminopyrimidine deaminase/5-amino-6-(5-phosphoribosylamino)uracil reductase RibD [Nonomuraea fuscirosea]PRX62623.1 diaminohydroxyphosphoribosylaminopyrimidine deaminase [Nonomuraea fuscirosea]
MEIPAEDVAPMARAVELAGRGHGTTSPNPVVGCVVLDSAGQVAGEGFHAYAGGPHAEIVALAQAGERAKGGTAYVTLEPCDHTGRTGPCSRALLDAGVARVVIAVPDPTPKAAGGAARLRAHGVEVTSGVLAERAERVNEEWLTYARLGRPHVTWKFAATLDGRSAAEDGTSQWITSPEARADVHRLRAAADAIVAGIGTVLADDPRLTARPSTPGEGPAGVSRVPGVPGIPSVSGITDIQGIQGIPSVPGLPGDRAGDHPRDHPRDHPGNHLGDHPGHHAGDHPGHHPGHHAGDRPRVRVPLRVVVDPDGRTPPSARVLDGQAPTLVAVADDARTGIETDLLPAPGRAAAPPHAPDREAGESSAPGRESGESSAPTHEVDLVRVPRRGAGLDLEALLRELAARGVVSVFLEGGPTLAGSFVGQGLVDRVVAYVAPALLGSGRAALGDAGVRTIGELPRLTFDEISQIGPDLRLIARPNPQPGREK